MGGRGSSSGKVKSSYVEGIKKTVKDTFKTAKKAIEMIETDKNRIKLASEKLDDMLKQEMKQKSGEYWVELYTQHNDILRLKSNLKNAMKDNDAKLINKSLTDIISSIRAYRKWNGIK